MKQFKVYVGLGGGFGGFGGFGGADYQETVEAMEEESAREIYLSYGGTHGLLNYEIEAEEDPEITQEDFASLEEDDFQSWADYYVEEVK